MSLFLQHKNTCRHASFCVDVHKLHRGNISSLRTIFSFFLQLPKYLPY